MSNTIAFIGLGHMGKPMALNLLKAGHSLKVFDLNADAMKELQAAGAQVGESAVQIAKDAQMVFTMLPAGRHVRQVYEGENGLLHAVAPGTVLVDCSTIDASTSQDLAAKAAKLGLLMLDAPVSGGTGGAMAGTLTFMVGGEDPALEKARPYLEAMGKNIFHAGKAGAGQVAKICNNMLLGILMAGTAEALALGVAHGLDPAVLSSIMARSSGRNWATELYNPWPGVMPDVPASRDYQGGFATGLMLKDLGLAADAAVSQNSATPLGELARNLFALHAAQGQNAGLDFSSILNLYRQKS
ncbi:MULTISPECIES: 3-hydroxyisobutyrate dehydrogenase [Alcaligenes]|uniref:3-hydroxyisobutyrate dehydrogenase n=1 Tax=Alcaligenes TaxID=507 RepID=UPI0002AAB9B5|nr:MULTISPECIES: 3-hydroxyisobutyrate dehydrogenase [Alcaligenes]EKU31706.1 3-hydroxyisobutyrate dehydrogenase [Alcaligenes sp. HPC1271]ERI34243.1 3-hydroxyisobutyrate dehydrogenase [Alcaligenes sp. EGD-AK7]HRO19070.1 3-hydroxyisobutyrate dehydrogenase [Alcaligenes phenolicus]HRP14907.1 3-hydroxyisobutyrate dehydrogenase [Alcaligenes phenolicus]